MTGVFWPRIYHMEVLGAGSAKKQLMGNPYRLGPYDCQNLGNLDQRSHLGWSCPKGTQGASGDIFGYFGGLLALISGGQGCCSTPHSAQDGPTGNNLAWTSAGLLLKRFRSARSGCPGVGD